jgi:hypothetical protein
MGFCANCGTPRNGNVRFCGTCGTEFTDPPAAPDEQATQASGWTAPADATRTDMSPRDTRIDPPGAKADQPDPFASWYSSAQPAAAPEPPRGGPDMYWQQPTETVRPAAQGPGGYPPPPPPGGYAAPPAPVGYPTAAYGAPYPPGRAGGPPQGGGRGRSGLLVVLAILVVLAAGGGAYALATRLGKHSTAGPSSTSAASSPSGATQPATGTRPASASASAPASSSSASPSPTLSLVAIGSGVSGAAVPQVQQLLNKRFEAINTHNYTEYASTLTTRAQASQPQSNFDKGYASTSDSAITLTALTQTSSGLTATVAFTSHQNPSDSVDGSACNTWTSTYYLVPSGSGYLIDTGSPPPVHGDC